MFPLTIRGLLNFHKLQMMGLSALMWAIMVHFDYNILKKMILATYHYCNLFIPLFLNLFPTSQNITIESLILWNVIIFFFNQLSNFTILFFFKLMSRTTHRGLLRMLSEAKNPSGNQRGPMKACTYRKQRFHARIECLLLLFFFYPLKVLFFL